MARVDIDYNTLSSPGKVQHYMNICLCTPTLVSVCTVYDLQKLCSEVDPSLPLQDCLQCVCREGMCSRKTLDVNSRATDLYRKARFQAGVSYCLLRG